MLLIFKYGDPLCFQHAVSPRFLERVALEESLSQPNPGVSGHVDYQSGLVDIVPTYLTNFMKKSTEIGIEKIYGFWNFRLKKNSSHIDHLVTQCTSVALYEASAHPKLGVQWS